MILFNISWGWAAIPFIARATYSIGIEETFTPKTTLSGASYQELVSGINKPKKDTRKYAGIRLNNHLNAILVSDPSADKSSASLKINIGHLDNPKDLPGLAHFVEHLLFMGSEKYPKINDFGGFIGNNSGARNAMTMSDGTVYYFDINNDAFEGCLDRFAQLFISPLISQEAVDKEINAVDSEFKRGNSYDSRRARYVQENVSNPDHPFSWIKGGNRKSLVDIPKSKGIDTRSEAAKFFREKYSANLMSLAVVSNQPMDNIKDLVVSKFSDIKNLNFPVPSHPGPVYRDEDKALLINIVPKSNKYSIQFQFELPTQIEDYKCVPIFFIATYLGYEGPGSLLSVLKSKGWATSFGVSMFNIYNGFAVLHIVSDLTSEGMNNKDNIVKYLFETINIFKRGGVSEQRFKEIQFSGDVEFQFDETKKGIDLTATLVASMASTAPLAEALWPIYNPKAFNETSIMRTLEYITPRNMRITILDPANSALPKLITESWSGAKFTHQKLEESFLDELEKVLNATSFSNQSGIKLPLPNKFIPTKFAKVQSTEAIVHPVVIYKSNSSILWHTVGKDQGLKAGMNILICSNISSSSPSNVVYTNLLKTLISNAVSEVAYDGTNAGMETEIKVEGCGITVKVAGFDQHIDLYIGSLIDLISSLTVDDKKLTKAIKILKTEWEDSKFESLNTQTKYIFEQIFIENIWNNTVLLKALDALNLENTIQFNKDFFLSASLKTLAVGNITPEKATDIIKGVDKLIKGSFADNSIAATRTVSLTEGESWLYNVLLDDKDSDQSAIGYFLNFNDVYDYETEIYTKLIGNNINSFAYDMLRNQMQLGYSVGSRNIRIGSQSGVVVKIESSREPSELEEIIETMLASFHELIRRMDAKEFSSAVATYTESIQNKFRGVKEKRDYYWGFILDQSYNFDYEDKMLMNLKNATLPKLLAVMDKNFLKESSHRRKFSINMISSNSKSRSDSTPSQSLGTLVADIDSWKASHLPSHK